MSEYSLFHWLAQTYGVNLNEWPTIKPDYIPKEAYEQIKKLFKAYTDKNRPADE